MPLRKKSKESQLTNIRLKRIIIILRLIKYFLTVWTAGTEYRHFTLEKKESVLLKTNICIQKQH